MPSSAESAGLPAPYSRANLERNLAALDRRDAALAARLRLPVASDHVQLGAEGGARLRCHRTWFPLDAAPLPGTRFFGIGLGESVEAALRASDGGSVEAWDRDPWMLRLALSRHDWSADIAAGRLRLLLGADLVDGFEGERVFVTHPLLGRIYGDERELLRADAGRPRALLATGGLFVDALGSALRELGFGVYRVDLTALAEEEIAYTAQRLGPRFLAAINYVDGLAELCASVDLPGFAWEIDPSTSRLADPQAPKGDFRIYTWRAAHVPLFLEAGFRHVEHVPLAADPEVREPVDLTGEERARYNAPVAFVGASMVANAGLCRARFLALWRAFAGDEPAPLDTVLGEQRRDPAHYRLPELLEEASPEFLHTVRASVERHDPVLLAAEIAGSEKRLAAAANLGRFGIRVWGDQGWRAVERFGVTYEGPARHGRELNRIYSGAAINLDMGRIYQDDIVTMRVFDALACGGFVLAERSRDLHELFEVGVEVEDYGDFTELGTQVERWLADPEAARTIANRGRAAVLERHTLATRVARMVQSTLDARASTRRTSA